jgi:hypothetical protein
MCSPELSNPKIQQQASLRNDCSNEWNDVLAAGQKQRSLLGTNCTYEGSAREQERIALDGQRPAFRLAACSLQCTWVTRFVSRKCNLPNPKCRQTWQDEMRISTEPGCDACERTVTAATDQGACGQKLGGQWSIPSWVQTVDCTSSRDAAMHG